MGKVNISIQSFVEKLKKIDVVELLEKAQAIKIEDLKKFKFSDFKRSKIFYPTIGLMIAFLFINILLIPSIKQTKIYRDKSKLYISEFKKTNLLQETLAKKINLKENLKQDLRNLDDLVSNNYDVMDFSVLLDKASKDSNVFIKIIRPISEKKMKSICLLTNNTERKTQSSFNKRINNELNFNKNNDDLAVEPSSFIVDINRLDKIFSKSTDNIGSLYKQNYFFIETESTFQDYLLFLKKLQSYKTTIMTNCYLTNISRSTNKNISIKNKETILNTKFILNYPTK